MWDARKEQRNRAKHGLGFDEVRELFQGMQDHLVIYDSKHSEYEDRFVAIGAVARGIVAVVHAEPEDDMVRVVSARFATPTEERLFHRYREGRRR